VLLFGRYPSGRAFRYIFFAKKKAKKDAAATPNAPRPKSVRYENIKYAYTDLIAAFLPHKTYRQRKKGKCVQKRAKIMASRFSP